MLGKHIIQTCLSKYRCIETSALNKYAQVQPFAYTAGCTRTRHGRMAGVFLLVHFSASLYPCPWGLTADWLIHEDRSLHFCQNVLKMTRIPLPFGVGGLLNSWGLLFLGWISTRTWLPVKKISILNIWNCTFEKDVHTEEIPLKIFSWSYT